MSRILLVEDDAMVGDSLARLLRLLLPGVEIVRAETLEEATAALGEGEFTALVSDYDLGRGATGLDVIRAAPDSVLTVIWSGVSREQEIAASDVKPDHLLEKSQVDELAALLSRRVGSAG